MRIHKAALTAAVVAVTMGATACGETGTPLTAPEEAVSLQRQGVGQATFGLINLLNNVAVQIQALQNFENLVRVGDINIEDVDVRVVNVENVLNNAQILNNARFLNNITILQDFLNNSEFLTNFLNNNNINIEDVVAIEVNLLTGTINVFTFDDLNIN